MTRTFVSLLAVFCFNWILGIFGAEYEATDLALRASSDAYATVNVDTDTGNVTVTLTVTSSRWVGIGFGSSTMPGTYAIIAYGTTDVMERNLNSNAQGSLLTNTLTVLSDSITDSIRTIVVTRDLDIGDSDYYDFSGITGSSSISIIWGVGSSTSWAKHSNKGSKTMSFTEILPTKEPTALPTNVPTTPTEVPSMNPSSMPSDVPTAMPTTPTELPTALPSNMPTEPTEGPTMIPSSIPSSIPSDMPTEVPSQNPTKANSDPPTSMPTPLPTEPSVTPSAVPSTMPTSMPTDVPALFTLTLRSSADATYNLSCNITVYEDDTIILTLGGPAGQWIGFGFGSTYMNNSYAIIVNGDNNVEQRVLAYWAPGTELTNDESGEFTILSVTIMGSMRYVEMTQDVGELYFDFGALVGEEELEYMMASSEAVNLTYHDWKESGTAALDIIDDDTATPAPVTPGEQADGAKSVSLIVCLAASVVGILNMF